MCKEKCFYDFIMNLSIAHLNSCSKFFQLYSIFKAQYLQVTGIYWPSLILLFLESSDDTSPPHPPTLKLGGVSIPAQNVLEKETDLNTLAQYIPTDFQARKRYINDIVIKLYMWMYGHDYVTKSVTSKKPICSLHVIIYT